MGTKKPQQEDQDNDGIADDEQTQSRHGQALDDDGIPDGETRVQSNPIIINR